MSWVLDNLNWDTFNTYTYKMARSETTTGRDIARGLRAAYLHMHRQTQAVLAEQDMTADQFVLLAVLDIEDGVTQQVLTSRASSDPNTVRAMLLLLERKGLVIRRRHATDRRARRVFLTAKAKRTYAQLSAALKPLQDALLSLFTERQAADVVTHLNRIADAMK